MLSWRFGGKGPKWYQLYFFLAAFELVTVCTGLYLTHRIIRLSRGLLRRMKSG